jgi:hypothetical protein
MPRRVAWGDFDLVGQGIFSGNLRKGELKMEKQLGTVAYWIGVVSTVVAIVTRLLTSIGIFLFPLPTPGRVPISYRSFLDGAMLFFVMAIASSVALWVKQQRS